MHAVHCALFAASGRNEAPERRFKVREKTCCSLLHNRHPVTFSSTAGHSMQAKNNLNKHNESLSNCHIKDASPHPSTHVFFLKNEP
jgi:hypothetical protein